MPAMRRTLAALSVAALAVALVAVLTDSASPARGADATPAARLGSAFTDATAHVNGIDLHYVRGGSGPPLILLHGYPQTWWGWNRVMPALARDFDVIAVDLRGAGDSSRPRGGYDKRTMAKDVKGLVDRLRLRRVHIAAHDMGAQVGYAFAARYPARTGRLAILDVTLIDRSFAKIPALNVQRAPAAAYPWWFAFHSVPELPQQLIQGQERLYLDWHYDTLARDRRAITEADRVEFTRAYSKPGSFETANAWYGAFPRDIRAFSRFGRLDVPALGLAGEDNAAQVRANLTPKFRSVRTVRLRGAGHWPQQEQPAAVVRELRRHFLAAGR